MDKPDDYSEGLEGLSIRESRTECIIIIGILFLGKDVQTIKNNI